MAEQYGDDPPSYDDPSDIGPPPKYKTKRTPSQEEIYIRELKSWAAEKEKMNPGAYGEYFFGVSGPSRSTPQRNGERHLPSASSDTHITLRDTRDLQAIAESQASRGTHHDVESAPSRRDSVEEMTSANTGSGSIPKEGVFRRRMSSFMKKIVKQENETAHADSTTRDLTEHSDTI